MKVFVRSFPGPGFANVCARGLFWPGTGVTVQVTKDEEDPEPVGDGSVKPGRKIGQLTYKALQQTQRFALVPAESVEDVDSLKARIAELEGQHGEHAKPAKQTHEAAQHEQAKHEPPPRIPTKGHGHKVNE